MTFDKPTFVKPDSATIADLEFTDIYIGGLKIGSLLKAKNKYHLEVMYNKYELKYSERSQIMTIINIEYAKSILHVLSSIDSNDLDKWKIKMDKLHNERAARKEHQYKKLLICSSQTLKVLS